MSRLGSCQTEYEASARNSVYGKRRHWNACQNQMYRIVPQINLQGASQLRIGAKSKSTISLYHELCNGSLGFGPSHPSLNRYPRNAIPIVSQAKIPPGLTQKNVVQDTHFGLT